MRQLYTTAILPLLLLGATACHKVSDTPSDTPEEKQYISVPVAPVSAYHGDVASSNQDNDKDKEDWIKSIQFIQLDVPSGKNNFFGNSADGRFRDNIQEEVQIKMDPQYIGYEAGTGWAFLAANVADKRSELTNMETNHRSAGDFYNFRIAALPAVTPPFPMSMTCRTIKVKSEDNRIKIGISAENSGLQVPGVMYLDHYTEYFQIVRAVAALRIHVEYNGHYQSLTNFRAEVRNVPKTIRLFARGHYHPGDYYSDSELTTELNKAENSKVKANLIKAGQARAVTGDDVAVDFGRIYVPESYPANDAYPSKHMVVRLHFTEVQNGNRRNKYIDITQLPRDIVRNKIYDVNLRLKKAYQSAEVEIRVEDWVNHEVTIPTFS